MRKELLIVGAVLGAIELSQWAFTNGQKEEIRKRQGYKCDETGRYGNTQVHHIVPQAMGGSDELINGVALSPEVHQKWDKLAREGIIYPGISITEAKDEQWKSQRHKDQLFAKGGR